MPVYSERVGDSALSRPIFTRLSSSCFPTLKIFDTAKKENLRLGIYFADERTFLGDFSLPVGSRKKCWVDLARQFALDILQSAVKTSIVQIISDHHQIDIAVRGVRALSHGPVDECSVDPVRQRL